MNCKKARNLILLSDAGETLSESPEAHLRECAECRAFRRVLLASQDLPAASPPGNVLENVLREAGRRVPRRPARPLSLPRRPRTLLALAASAAILLGAALFQIHLRNFSGPFISGAELLDVEQQAAYVQYATLTEDDFVFNFLMASPDEG